MIFVITPPRVSRPRDNGDTSSSTILAHKKLYHIASDIAMFIDDSKNFQPSNATGILCGCPLGIIEVSRHSNNCFGHFVLAKKN
uniref:Uncharacterized protein n=1 Tax=Salix viminalis TaxID=40686 RepID=A0A6N2M7V6_SALVM